MTHPLPHIHLEYIERKSERREHKEFSQTENVRISIDTVSQFMYIASKIANMPIVRNKLCNVACVFLWIFKQSAHSVHTTYVR